MDFASACSRRAMAAAGSMSPRSSMSRAIFTWVSTEWMRTPSPRRSITFASTSVRVFVASANCVLRRRAFSSISFAISEAFLLRDPGDLLDRLRVETQSLHGLNPGLEVLQRFLIFAEPFVEGDGDGLGPPRGLNRLRVLVCAEELLRDLERVLRGLDVRHRQSQDGDESLCVPNRFLRMTRLRRLQEADPRDLVVEHVILPLEETRSDHTWGALAKPVGCRIH